MDTTQTQTRTELLAAFKARLEQLRIPHHTLQVFGVIRINVHVTCKSRDTAEKWHRVLVRLGGKANSPSVYEWPTAKPGGTNLRPTMHRGWFIGAII